MSVMWYMLQAYYACLCYTGMFSLDCPNLAEDGLRMRDFIGILLIVVISVIGIWFANDWIVPRKPKENK